MAVGKSEAIKVTCMGCLYGSPYKKAGQMPLFTSDLTQSGQMPLFTHPNSQGEAESRCPACSNDHFSEILPQMLMTLISLLGPTGEQDCLVLSGSPEHVSHKS